MARHVIIIHIQICNKEIIPARLNINWEGQGSWLYFSETIGCLVVTFYMSVHAFPSQLGGGSALPLLSPQLLAQQEVSFFILCSSESSSGVVPESVEGVAISCVGGV